jgi:hypothetical protein
MASIDQQQINKFFNFKIFLFPYGIITLGLAWTTFFLTLYPVVFDSDPLYWWGKLIVIFSGIVVIAIINYSVNFVFKINKVGKLRVF